MGNVVPLVSMIAGLGAGTLSFVASRQRPERERALRAVGASFLWLALAMALLMAL